MKYYRLNDNVEYKGRWFLGNVEGVKSVWDFFNTSKVIYNDPLKVAIDHFGLPLDFTFAAFDTLIVNEKTKVLFKEEDVFFYPILLGDLVAEKYYVMQIRNKLDCVDEEKSTFDKWEEGNDIRPDKAGEYMTIYNLKLKKQHYSNEIFRVKDYGVAIIVSGTLKESLEQNKISGVLFKEV